MSKSENPLLPEDDPLAALLESNIETMSAEEISAYVEKLHVSTNNPRELTRLITGAQRKEKKKGKSARSAAESATLAMLLESL